MNNRLFSVLIKMIAMIFMPLLLQDVSDQISPES